MKFRFSFRRFWSIFTSRNREFYRDWGTLGWVFLFPFLMVIAFGYIFNLDDLGIYKVGRIGTSTLPTSTLFQYVTIEQEQGLKKLEHHRIDLWIENDLVWYNESSIKSKTALKILQGETIAAASFEVQSLTGRQIRYIDWLFPGLLSLNILWMSLWGVGWVIVRHRKLGILKRYKASPVTAFEYLLAQMSSRLIVLVFSGVVVFAGAYLIHPFPIEGRAIDLLVIYTLGCFCHSAIGMIIAARMTSEELANGILNLITYPIMFVSEVWFSLEGSPEWVLSLAHLTPLWHMTDGMRKIMFEGYGLAQLSTGLAIFTGVTLVGLILGSYLFQWTGER